jgi:hypothetical protein
MCNDAVIHTRVNVLRRIAGLMAGPLNEGRLPGSDIHAEGSGPVKA